MSYLKDREVWLEKTPTGNPPAGYYWKFIQDGVVVVRDSDGVDKKMVAKTSDTGAAELPVGTSAQRPITPEAGMIRFNTDRGLVEWYDDITDNWVSVGFDVGVAATGGTVTDIELDGQLFRVHTFTSDGTFNVTRGGEVEYLVVAGGGGGGGGLISVVWGPGGGGGEVILVESATVSPQAHTITVGAGGAASAGVDLEGNDGASSAAFGTSAIGGKGGTGSDGDGVGGASGSGQLGGSRNGLSSGGGAGDQNPGGNAPTSNTGGNGGDGKDASAIFGTGVGDDGFFGGGGAGNNGGGSGTAFGGKGGGATLVQGNGTDGAPGIPNTGGGGSERNAGSGGSGIVIIRYRIG